MPRTSFALLRVPPLAGSLATAFLFCAASALHAATPAQPPELQPDQARVEPLAPADGLRLYVTDPTMAHLVDGRVHVVDGGTMRYLGLIGSGFAASTALSGDHSHLFIATTFYSRLDRGIRTDVVEAYRTSDLTFDYEIEIPAKHVESLPMKALLRPTADGRFLLVQNATPATSVTVVDLQSRKVSTQVGLPGCYGIIPWPSQPRRFSALCGDGTMTTVTLDDAGALAQRIISARFFDPDTDPVYMHYQMLGDELVLVSYGGAVYTADLSGAQPVFAAPWSFVSAADRKTGWRPGGYELFAVDPHTQRLYIGMHPKGKEGSHKDPATQLWTLDLNAKKVLARTPGYAAVSMTLTGGDKPSLALLSGADNTLVLLDLNKPGGLAHPLRRSAPVGETPIYLEAQ